MGVELEDAKVAYSGSGSAGPFDITFYFLENSHILATKLNAAGTATVLVLTTDYTLTGAADEDGGTLTLMVALAVGETLTIERNVPLTQETNWPTADPFPAASHERAADKGIMIAQQLDARLNRTIRQPTTDTTAISELPIASARASMFLAFDANGQLIVAAGTSGDLSPVSAFVDTLLDDADAAAARATLGSTATGDAVFIAATAAAARTTLGSTATGDAVFIAANAAAARATLGVQTATTSAEGLVELATQPEMDAGTAGKVLTADLNKITLYATQATTSGTSKDFSGLPTGIRELKVAIVGVSTSGMSRPIIQLGEVGAGLKVSGYLGSGSYIDSTPTSIIENHDTGFRVGVNDTDTAVIHGIATFMHMTGNVWAYSFIGGRSDATAIVKAGGSVTLAGVLDRVRLTTINGTDTFDAGSVNIAYER